MIIVVTACHEKKLALHDDTSSLLLRQPFIRGLAFHDDTTSLIFEAACPERGLAHIDD
jgi:hypothetical protein